MTQDRFAYTLDGELAIIRMDDGKVNAIQGEFLAGINAALDRATKDRARAVVLAGKPGCYSAGLDLKKLPTLEPDVLRQTLMLFGETMLRLFLFPRPIVAAVTGHAIAGGAVVLLAADKRVATEGPYKIGLNEVAISIPLPGYVLDMAMAALPPQHHTDALLHGRLYSPGDALRVGYVDEVVPAGEVFDRACQIARGLSILPDAAYMKSKDLLRGRLVAQSRGRMGEELAVFMGAVGGAAR